MHARELAPAPEDERRVVLEGIPWAVYVTLRDAVPGGGTKMTYFEGRLEIMSPSRRHEVWKTQVARLLELFCLERDIPLYGYGSLTIREEDVQRGLEPDECYARGAHRARPDLAIEVVVSTDLVDKLEVYRGLGIGEVWRFAEGTFTVLELGTEGYRTVDRSKVLPEVDLEEIAELVQEDDQHAALRTYRDRLRQRS